MVYFVNEQPHNFNEITTEVWNGRKLPIAAMTGVNGDTNGSNTNGTTSATDKGCWTIGLINSKYKYLSAETFGFRTNANGKALKKKQVWILEPSGNGESVVLRSHLNKYVAVDQFGNVTCDQEEKDETSKFEISVCDDQSGRWAFKSLSRGYFLGASSDNLICSAKSPGDAELWFVHLAARPQVNLKSIGRKRFAHLSENQEEIHVEENVPWGEDTLFTLEFREGENKYAIHTCTNMYLQRDGKLTSGLNKECFFSVEYHGGYIALRDYDGQYLSPIGSRAVLKTRSNSVTKDELFSLEDSLPQAAFVAVSNSKHVSVKQGVDVTANQDEISDYETFQMEYEQGSRRWYIRTMQDKYFTVQTGGGIQANENKRSPNAMFDVEWHTDGTISFKANNGKYVGIKKSGHLFANTDEIEENAKYFFYLVNRPILVLKCEQGFVGYKSTGSTKLECNKANYETIIVERSEKGLVHFKGQNGKYINARNDGLSADSDSPSGFYLELRDPTRMCIKSSDGQYLNSEKNGCLALTSTDIDEATQWEY
ncbi:protein singed isoform X2 [Lepeophtheirus salmonis]|uniref:protein singed isoform X2 n=1 Tax=Lepeophtheirus salmonis TaxID=72036 RepID=UPI001AEAA7CE|nr:protein singed-like isoform X2 [Lepeophtheirus salmonis]